MLTEGDTHRQQNARAAFLFTSQPDFDDRIKLSQVKKIRTVYADIGWKIEELFCYMEQAEDYYFDSISQVEIPNWYNRRIVLLGDAGYCASPLSGQGTSLALVGAYVLAHALHESGGDFEQAYFAYQERLKPFVEKNQALGRLTATDLTKGYNEKITQEERLKLFEEAANAISI